MEPDDLPPSPWEVRLGQIVADFCIAALVVFVFVVFVIVIGSVAYMGGPR